MSTLMYKSIDIQLINQTDDLLPYYEWLKSRAHVIDADGFMFMKNMTFKEFSKNYKSLPNRFRVGNEVVDKEKYRERIESMNLQYNNSVVYTFQIQGSCLFRDILYTFNHTGQWATSSRFRFSTFSKDQIFNPSNYEISGEYSIYPDWVNQFNKYMNKIREIQITDENRIEMPYSISSQYFWTVNKKDLYEILTWIKNELPFFWSHYGRKIADLTKMNISENNYKRPALVDQYYLHKSLSDKDLGLTKIGDECILQTKMSLILFSQFLRQSGSKTAGLFDVLTHPDQSVFDQGNQVLSGGTVIEVRYIASYSKLIKTIKTRLCAFAMSSGDGPASWNSIIQLVLSDSDFAVDNFKNWLPCRITESGIENCPYYDDIKFRNEGLETNNCPCPLLSKSMKDAEFKKNRDKNKIGDAFYNLTKQLTNNQN